MLWAGNNGWIGPGVEFLGLCHDDPDITVPQQIRYDACVVVQGEVKLEGALGMDEIPGGEYAVIRHVGAYADLGEAYLKLLGSWLPGSGREVAHAPCVEIYFNDPESTPVEELETDVALLLLDDDASTAQEEPIDERQ